MHGQTHHGVHACSVVHIGHRVGRGTDNNVHENTEPYSKYTTSTSLSARGAESLTQAACACDYCAYQCACGFSSYICGTLRESALHCAQALFGSAVPGNGC